MMSSAGLGAESWDDLFDFLDPKRRAASGPDRDKEAETRCGEIMRKLVCFFAGRRCANPEDLAMETILRVASKCREVDVSSYADRVGYFYGVARNVVHEVQRNVMRESKIHESFKQELMGQAPPDPDDWNRTEAAQSCLDRCMAKLPHQAKRLIVQYYAKEGSAKVTSHRALADELGKSVNALRIEVHRIRKMLQQCVFACLHPGAGAGHAGAKLVPN